MRRWVMAAILVVCQGSVAEPLAPRIEVLALFTDGAVLVINGKQHFLKRGASSPEGVKVLEANAKVVTLEVEGEVKKMSLSKKIGTQFASAAAKAEVRIRSGPGGHYWTPGLINNRPCEFIVDTGATFVSMNSQDAERLGVAYQQGTPITMRTASGLKRAFKLTLKSVAVGAVTARNVDAVVTEGEFPEVILLGNTFLQRVEMRINADVMVLQSKI